MLPRLDLAASECVASPIESQAPRAASGAKLRARDVWALQQGRSRRDPAVLLGLNPPSSRFSAEAGGGRRGLPPQARAKIT